MMDSEKQKAAPKDELAPSLQVHTRAEDATPSSEESSLCDKAAWDATTLSPMRKLHIVIAGFTCTFNGNFGSSLPSGGLDAISAEFGVDDRLHLILLNSLYMTGYVLGPLLFGPLSECIGRRPVLVGSFVGYLVFMLACSAAPSYAALLVFRLLCGVHAAAPTTVIGGLYADILDDPAARGNAMAVYMTVTTMGPVFAPVISGFSSTVSWRLPFWIAGGVAALGLPLVLTMPETYAPVLRARWVQRQDAKSALDASDAGLQGGQKLGQHGPQDKAFDLQKIFLRPMHLLFTEPIVFCTSAYLALAYSIFYLLFQAYPIVFQDFYGLPPGVAGLAMLPLAVGALGSLLAFYAFTWYHDRENKAGAAWTKNEMYRRMPLACTASPCMVIALFWLGWTVQPSLSPVVPSLCGLFFGLGFQLLFMGMTNYLTDVYRQYSASAQAASSMTRSIGAVLLPLATESMYGDLGIHWGPSVLAFIALAMAPIPFIFIKYGDRLARSSKTAREMQQL